MFRFTIRDVLWLMVVIAILCAWHLSNERWSSRLAKTEDSWAEAWGMNRGLVHEIETANREARPINERVVNDVLRLPFVPSEPNP